MSRNTAISTSLLSILILMLGLSCCKDCPDCPSELEPPAPGHYRVYAFDALYGFIMSIDSPADTIVDSIRVDYSGADVFVTPDGMRLLVMRFNYKTGHKMEIYSTSDLSHLGSSDQYGSYYFDGTDNYGLFTIPSRGQICFIEPVNFTLIDSIPRAVTYGYLDTVTNQFFCASDSSTTIYRVDCDTRTLADSSSMATGNPLCMAYNWMTNDIYFHAWGPAPISSFFQYDIDGDSMVSATRTTAPFGDVAVSPDGRLIYMTDPGDGMHFIYPPGEIYVYDALTHRPIALIPPYDFSGNERISTPLFGQVAITPDAQRAYISAGGGAGGGVPVAVVDLRENKIIKTISPYLAFMATAIAVGPVPE